jgi:YARHG domain
MTHRSRAISMVVATAAFAALGTFGGSSPANAQNYRQMSCEALWYARNQIYANYGYCFKTRRAIREFGRGCHPPFGRLPPRAQEEVDEIQHWERRNDCNDD